ncbi:hypothetical protein DL98DRAFT_13634 [Cadophora sp. DSE1049]|nr:hypothetical protein DL98DRAFT_13634 [Cadophora sp. DSE1049]
MLVLSVVAALAKSQSNSHQTISFPSQCLHPGYIPNYPSYITRRTIAPLFQVPMTIAFKPSNHPMLQQPTSR